VAIKVDDKKIAPPATGINEAFNESIIMHFKLLH
jgi:hypothetical protein